MALGPHRKLTPEQLSKFTEARSFSHLQTAELLSGQLATKAVFEKAVGQTVTASDKGFCGPKGGFKRCHLSKFKF